MKEEKPPEERQHECCWHKQEVSKVTKFVCLCGTITDCWRPPSLHSTHGPYTTVN